MKRFIAMLLILCSALLMTAAFAEEAAPEAKITVVEQRLINMEDNGHGFFFAKVHRRFPMGLFYAFQSPFRQVFDKSFCHPIDRRRKPLISVDFLPLKCVDNRGFPALVFSTSFAALLYSKKALIL